MSTGTSALAAAAIQYVLNTIPLGNYIKAYVSQRFMIDMLSGFKPGPARLMPKFKYANNASAAAYAEGDADPATGTTSRRRIEFKYARYHAAFGIDGQVAAIAAAGGVDGLRDLVMDEAAGAIEDLFDQINTDLLGTHSANKIYGVQYHIADSGNYSDDVLDRAVYTWLASYVADNSGTPRNLEKALLEAIQTVYFKTRQARPNAIWCGIEQFQNAESLFDDKKRITVNVGELQLDTVTWNGIPFVPIPNYPSTRLDFVQVSDWGLYYLPQVIQEPGGQSYMTGPFRVEYKDTGYDESKFVIYFYPQMVCTNPFKQLALTDLAE